VQDYSQWKANQSFVATTVVMHESLFYKSLTGTNTSTPPNEDTTNWESVETVRQTQFEEYTISSKNGFNITISESLSSDIKSGFTWIIKENSQNHSKPRQYRIKQVREVSALQYEIAATEHLEDKYNQVDNSAGAQKGIEFESREYYGPPISTA
jgi:predicted phage tail protein